MECPLDVGKLQDIEIKKEVLEDFEFEVESLRDNISYIKQEPYDHCKTDRNSGVAVIKLEQEDYCSDKNNEPPLLTKKMTDRISHDDKDTQTDYEYNINLFKVKPVTVVPNQLNSNRCKRNFCKTCKKTFHSTITFEQHQKNVQCGLKPYICHLCNRAYSEMNVLSMHQVIVHKHKQVETNSCYSKQSDRALMELKNHNNYIGLSSEAQFLELQKNLPKCVVCNRVFSSKYALKNHNNHSLIHRAHVLLRSSK